ncbi:anti-phage deoxyguanosine triphosphatase [Pseudomonas sp. O64]|uniref:anti-phage deoxyguanosine triphosphatase n=1 Tax=unclassified Pseudomonas TaxID=196821 RepID=UPI0021DB72AB|nr:anti-phage deoxyguanosine triphosphatase [Pseudomonas sp. YeP6b]UXZ25143.1 deoxyguanosinetriphosphate triphosphohydrolase family protein [Pseudomonas sp. YeP6b]
MWKERKQPLQNDNFDRDQYARDRARVIHSAFFRRLQGKTQVLGLGESDFYRTRLTHSLEVAQLGSGLVEFLNEKYKNHPEIISFLPTKDLIETIGLAHDIGHPPFGHGGEVALNYSMREHGGFEGNAQTLRICTELGEYSSEAGLNLTRRTLLGILKYPATYTDTVNIEAYNGESRKNIDSYKPPKCIFDSDRLSLDWILNSLNPQQRIIFSSIERRKDKHNKPTHKSLDCSIMEIADDIAYGVHDLEDAIALGLVTLNSWNINVLDAIKNTDKKYSLESKIEHLTQNLFSGINRNRKKAIGELVNHFITATTISSNKIFSDEIYDLTATINAKARASLDLLQEFIRKNVILTPEVQTLEYKGQQMVIDLFDAIANNPNRLLPLKYRERYTESNDLRIVCDYLSGTTDDYATRLYHKIFTPSSGSIFDRL